MPSLVQLRNCKHLAYFFFCFAAPKTTNIRKNTQNISWECEQCYKHFRRFFSVRTGGSGAIILPVYLLSTRYVNEKYFYDGINEYE